MEGNNTHSVSDPASNYLIFTALKALSSSFDNELKEIFYMGLIIGSFAFFFIFCILFIFNIYFRFLFRRYSRQFWHYLMKIFQLINDIYENFRNYYNSALAAAYDIL